MVTKWEVRQQVRTVDKAWLVAISSSQSERMARMDYERCVASNPDGYFELIRVEHSEDCLAFTPKNDDGSPRWAAQEQQP